MPTIQVNNRPVEAHEGETLLDTLRRHGVDVPTLCHLRDMSPTGACRLCVVELEGRPGLVPSCAFPVQDGLSVLTHSPRALRARRTIVELLLSNHPDDCLYCSRAGDCELQGLARDLGVRERRFGHRQGSGHIDASSPALLRDPAKCVLCGKCVRVCDEVQDVAAIDFMGRGAKAVVAPAFDEGLNVSSCIACGQCITACPTGALCERSHMDEVGAALADPDTIVVVQHAPAVSVSLGEALGLPAGVDAVGAMTAALRRLGFDRVFDTAWSADLTVMEEATELVQRLTEGAGPLPLLTSCSPGWIKHVEQRFPDFIPNLSSCKSPQQMLGALIKTVWAEREGIDPERIISVSIMPCTAKKFEAGRPEHGRDGLADVDAVLTTRELAKLITRHGLALDQLAPEEPDLPFGERSSAGRLFGASGGVMEAALRTGHFMVTGAELPALALEPLRGAAPRKELRVKVGALELGVAVVSGLAEASRLLEEVRAGRDDLHFIEVMTCPGGCVAGGGQPIGQDPERVRARMAALYAFDAEHGLRTAHANPAVTELYERSLEAPGSPRAHHLLHTRYHRREAV